METAPKCVLTAVKDAVRTHYCLHCYMLLDNQVARLSCAVTGFNDFLTRYCCSCRYWCVWRGWRVGFSLKFVTPLQIFYWLLLFPSYAYLESIARMCNTSIDIFGTVTIAGIYELRRLQIKRCGRLGPRAVLALDCCPNILLFVHPLKIKVKSSYFLSR